MPELEKEIMEQVSKELAESIDFVIMAEILVEISGWTLIELDRFENNKHAVDIHVWLEENCKGQWRNNGANFLFENGKDATWFALNWYD